MKKNWKYQSPVEEGFHRVITIENSDLEYGELYRLNLPEEKEYSFNTNSKEMGLILVNGQAKIKVNNKIFSVRKFDAVYAPYNTNVNVTAYGSRGLTIYIGACQSRLNIEPYCSSFDKDLPVGDRRQVHGKGKCERNVYLSIGPQDSAYRLLMGFTWGMEGQWTSWPVHQHSETLEEIYAYFDMDWPHVGFQLGFEDINDMLICEVVQSGTAVVVPYGYHPTVAAPGSKNSYVWIMMAKDPAEKNRRYDLAKPYPGLDHKDY